MCPHIYRFINQNERSRQTETDIQTISLLQSPHWLCACGGHTLHGQELRVRPESHGELNMAERPSIVHIHTHTDNCFIMVVLHSQIVDVGLTTCKMLQIHSLIQWVIHKGQRSKGHLSGVSLINQGRQRRNTQCTLTKFLSFHLAKRTFIVYIYVENGQICPLKYFIDNI